MGRRLISTMVRMRGGPTLGGSFTKLSIYDDEALTVLSSLYRRATGVGTQPNPISPNAGKPTSLRAAQLATDTFADVETVAGFQVGDLQPIYSGANTTYAVVTAIDATTRRLTLDVALGFAFAAGTSVGNVDMRGHVWGFVDDVRDYFATTKDLASSRVMPPLQVPTRVPTSAISLLDETVAFANSRTILNFEGSEVVAIDDVANSRANIKVRSYVWLGGVM